MIRVYFSPAYVASGFAFDTTRKARWIADSLSKSPAMGIELAAPDPLTRECVAEVHDPDYVHAVETGFPRSLAESQGFAWDPGLWPMVLASNGGAVAAALDALKSGMAGSLSSGLHHARFGSGAGFCTFNGLVIAARAALGAGAGSVLILDFDAHCGGGTASLIEHDLGIWQIDVSVSSFDNYPRSGRVWLDVVPEGMDYLPAVRRGLAEADRKGVRFGLCLYNAGMDPYEGCSTGGQSGITREVLADRERMVFEWCGSRGVPIAFVLAGGYVGPRLDERGLVDLHRLTLSCAAEAGPTWSCRADLPSHPWPRTERYTSMGTTLDPECLEMNADNQLQLDALVPAEMAAKAEQIGADKAHMNIVSMFVLAVLAGAFISLGAAFSTTVVAASGNALPYGVRQLLAGLVFSLGLILVLVGGAELFTGNIMIVMAWASRRVSTRLLLRNWGVVFAGNLAGAVATAALVFVSNQFTFGSGAVGAAALATANAKTGLAFFPAVALGVLCNALVCLAVWLTASARTTTDRVLSIVPPVTAFVALGFEHSIANMYFIPMGLFIKAGAPESFWTAIGKSAADYTNLTWENFLLNNLIPVTLGNIVGGGVMVGAVYWFVYLRKNR